MTEYNNTCLGCSLANEQLPVYTVYETELVTCILDHDPFQEGHVLILPKVHVKEAVHLELTTATAIMETAVLLSKAINNTFKPDGITICQNGGTFNELDHVHVHVVPRYQHQSFADFYSDAPSDNEHLKKKLAETHVILQNAIREVLR
ncbi:HIT family protein [Fictibacillus iocasae]|uniref:HIT family protein n=1 Tax=Fictibacillus iocasae TaxID=2715437 RepID=A0ABW2NHU0_9BACL